MRNNALDVWLNYLKKSSLFRNFKSTINFGRTNHTFNILIIIFLYIKILLSEKDRKTDYHFQNFFIYN